MKHVQTAIRLSRVQNSTPPSSSFKWSFLFDMVTVFSIGFMQDLYICLYINLYLYYNVQGGAVIRQPADPKLSLHGLVYMWGVGLA